MASGGSGRSSALVRMHYSFPPEVDLAVKSLEIFRTWPEYVGRRRRLPPDRLRADRAGEGARPAREERRDAAGARRRRARRRPRGAVRDRSGLERGRRPAGRLGAGLGLRRRQRASRTTSSSAPAKWASSTGRRRASTALPCLEDGRVTGVVTDAGPRGRARGRGGDGSLEPAALRRRRVRPAGRGRVPRGRDPEEPAGAAEPGAGLHRRPHDDVLPLRGRRAHARRRFLRASAAWTRTRFRSRPATEALASLVERAARRVPALAEAGIWRGVTGVYDVSPDFRPLIGEVPRTRAGSTSRRDSREWASRSRRPSAWCVSELLLDGRATSGRHLGVRPGPLRRRVRTIRAEWEYGDEEPAAYT